MSRGPTGPVEEPALVSRLCAHLDRHPRLLPSGARILVALSGGPDSTALLHLLLALAPSRGWTLHAAHLDHGVRSGSAAEAERVGQAARRAGVPCRVGRAPADMERTQAAFRAARYRFLRREARRVGADRIATGHQADDQAETVLFRILRGTGLRGLAGIPARRGRVVRPLLPFRRRELAAWLQARDIGWVEDPSNRDPAWARGRIRHRILPALSEAAGRDVRPRLVALADRARRADRALERTARLALSAAATGTAPDGRELIARSVVAAYDPEVQARLVRRLARRRGVRLTRGGTRAAVEFIRRGRSGTAVDLAPEVALGREFDRLWVGPRPRPGPTRALRIPAPASGRGEAVLGGRRYAVRWGPEPRMRPPEPDGAGLAWPGGASPGGWRLDLPGKRAPFPLELRGPRPGDRLRGPAGSRKLNKLFGERRVPRWERPTVPVLVGADGGLLWVAGVGPSQGVATAEREERFFVDITQL